MMVIYYTHSFGNEKGESRRLLAEAIAGHLAAGRASVQGEVMQTSELSEHCDAAELQEMTETAGKLAASIQTAGEYGKPYIPGFAPFSVSHSMNTWAVLIADETDDKRPSGNAAGSMTSCGLDIQYPRKTDMQSVARRFYAPEDAELVAKAASGSSGDAELCDGPDPAAEGRNDSEKLFFRIWARREALIKAAGGSVADSGIPSVSGDEAVLGNVRYRLRDIQIPGSDAYAAVCISSDPGETAGEPVFVCLTPYLQGQKE